MGCIHDAGVHETFVDPDKIEWGGPTPLSPLKLKIEIGGPNPKDPNMPIK